MLLCFLFQRGSGQAKYDYNWVFGYGRSSPNDTNFFGGFIMKFDKSIKYIVQSREYDYDSFSASFSSVDGSFLYQSNGCLIADKNSKVILNGDSIGFGYSYINCPKINIDDQASLFVKFRADDSLTYFVHTQLDTIGKRLHRKRILLTTINKKYDSVIYKNVVLLKDTFVWMGLTGIPSTDTNYWWIVNPKLYTNKYVVLKFRRDGVVEDIFYRPAGVYIDSTMDGEAQASFSPNGKKFGIFFANKGLQIMDFDRTTGVMSNPRFFDLKYNRAVFGGCAFSPNSRYVYVNTNVELMQVDLEEPDSTKAIDTIGVYDYFFDPYPTTFLLMMLGPDCRIYMSTYGGNRYLHTILYPDRKGKACQFVQRGLKLPARNAFALPNNPHYRVDEPWPCDSTITIPLNTSVINPEDGVFRKGDLLIYPQPANDYILIQAIGMDDNPDKIEMFNAQGEVIISRRIEFFSQELRMDVSGFNAGMYFIKLSNRNRIWTGRVMIGS